VSVIPKHVFDSFTPRYTIRNLVTGKEYMVDVTHIRPFNFDPNYVTPLNIAAKDTDEYVVEKILAHDFSDFNDKRWLVKWASTEASNETWEIYETLKDVEAHSTVLHYNSILSHQQRHLVIQPPLRACYGRHPVFYSTCPTQRFH
jgi:hypothetical protein